MLDVTPITLKEAHVFVRDTHRHHKPAQGALFAIAASDRDGIVRAVAVVGRPVSRHLQDGWTVEVVRLASDGAHNACSMLYRAAWRAARALGYRRLITYTLESESGASLRAAGFKVIGQAGGGTWDRKARPRIDTHPTQMKLRWELSVERIGNRPDRS